MGKRYWKLIYLAMFIIVTCLILIIGYSRLRENSTVNAAKRYAMSNPKYQERLLNLRKSINKISSSPGSLKHVESKDQLAELVKEFHHMESDCEANRAYLDDSLKAIMEVNDPDLIPSLCKYAKSGVDFSSISLSPCILEATKLKISAIYALGNMQDKKSVHCLTDLLSENQMISCSASIMLGKMGATEAIDEMINNMVRTNYCSTAGISFLGEKGLKVIMDKLDDLSLSEDQKSELKAQLAGINDPEAKPLLKELFKSKDYSLRSSAGQSLMKMANSEDLEYFINGLKNKEFSEGSVLWAVAALGHIGDPRSVPTIENIFDNSPKGSRDWTVSFGALSEIEGDSFRPQILKYIYDDDLNVRKVAIDNLQYCAPKETVNILINIILSSEKKTSDITEIKNLNLDETKSIATRVLESYNSIESVNAAKILFRSNDEDVLISGITIIQTYAARNVSYKPQAVDIFSSLVESNSSIRIRTISLNSIAELIGKDAVPIINKYRNDPQLGAEADGLLNRIERGDLK